MPETSGHAVGPEGTVPRVPDPEVPAPEVAVPEVPAPEVVVPEVVVPEVAVPEVVVPLVPDPEVVPEGAVAEGVEVAVGAAVSHGAGLPADDDSPGARSGSRTRLAPLIGAAAALGVLVGTCAGYLVQVQRAPTPLPPLSQPYLTQAKGAGPERLPAAQDREVKTEGDLRKLLVPRPSGAQDPLFNAGADGWLSLPEYAGLFKKPAQAFSGLIADGFRRAAVADWREGKYNVEIRLVQYRQEERLAAKEAVENAKYWSEVDPGTTSRPVPGTGDGRVYVHSEPARESGAVPLYTAEAFAWRGDIAMEIWAYDSEPVPMKKIMGLAERQMGRL
ncbi:hypothetical protein [Streptomyces cavernae]|uniref:hypothetical protein n=1 Tax=Streptomyces cavernae TaxID=2259034 RepID=UPI001EE3FAD4|nr:hypothetical protein [Streptomyces cavernae]